MCQVNRSDDGMEAILFTAEGDMRQAINNLQSTHSGYGLVNRENVFKVRLISGLAPNSFFVPVRDSDTVFCTGL